MGAEWAGAGVRVLIGDPDKSLIWTWTAPVSDRPNLPIAVTKQADRWSFVKCREDGCSHLHDTA